MPALTPNGYPYHTEGDHPRVYPQTSEDLARAIDGNLTALRPTAYHNSRIAGAVIPGSTPVTAHILTPDFVWSTTASTGDIFSLTFTTFLSDLTGDFGVSPLVTWAGGSYRPLGGTGGVIPAWYSTGGSTDMTVNLACQWVMPAGLASTPVTIGISVSTGGRPMTINGTLATTIGIIRHST